MNQMRISLDAHAPDNIYNDKELQLETSHSTYYTIGFTREACITDRSIA